MAARKVINLSLDHPRWTLALFLLVTAGWSLGLPRLMLEVDGRAMLPPDSPTLVFQSEVDNRYAPGNYLIIGVEAAAADRSVFTPEVLNYILHLTEKLQAMDAVAGQEVRSLATAIRPSKGEAGLSLSPLLVGEVLSEAEAEEVRAACEQEPLFSGVLVSRDGRGTNFYIPLREGTDRRLLFDEIERLATEEAARIEPASARPRLHFLGSVVAESLLGGHILKDLTALLPLALGVVAIILWLWFRQWLIVAVGLGEALAVVVWSMGLMGLAGEPISLVTVVMPVILAIYCVADTIHIAQRFRNKCSASPEAPRRRLMAETLEEILKPMVFTSLTTGAGFLSFMASPIPPLYNFGLYTAFGIFAALGISLLVVPSLILWGSRERPRAERATNEAVVRVLQKMALKAARSPVLTLAAFVCVTALLAAGMARLQVQDSWVHNFEAGSPLVRSDAWFNRNFLGSNVLNVVIKAEGERGAYDPAFLRGLDSLQARLVEMAEVGGSLSLTQHLRAVGRTLEGDERLPQTPGEAEEWALLYQMADGSGSLNAYVNAEASEVNLWVFINQADYQRTAAVVNAIERLSREHLQGPASHPRFTGDAYRGYLLVDSITESQYGSLLTALLVVFALLLGMLRSFVLALLGILPVSLAIFWNFGLMGWSEMPLGVATSTFSAIAIGIGVDFALHWIARLRLAVRETPDWEAAVSLTNASSGGAILVNGLALFFGFGVLLLSSVPANQRLGLLMCINLFASLGASLLLLPALACLARRSLREERPAPLVRGGVETA
jgi:predicted RND superfamily exporter protein